MNGTIVGKIRFSERTSLNFGCSYLPYLPQSNKEINPQARIIQEIIQERKAQDKKWGEQNHKPGTSRKEYGYLADLFRKVCDNAFHTGKGTWTDILLEEVFEALAEEEPAKIKKELKQVAAVVITMLESLDRNELKK